MKDSFKSVACTQDNSRFENSTKRESQLYSRGNDIRTEFERDCTRLLHCQAYRRLKHKTQVFFAPHNDHVCTRMEHVQHVASVATTIAKYLGLNDQLTQAIATGHDIGHAPFGHFGEECLNKILGIPEDKNAPKKFWHERNSLFFADYIETLSDPYGDQINLDLTYAVRDGLICHCGEIDQQAIKPREDNIDLYSIKRPGLIQPYTWEGCVVKVADKIAFLGRDIEDAKDYGIIDEAAYRQVLEIVGSTLGFSENAQLMANKKMAVNTTVLINDLIVDMCNRSSPETGLAFSEEYFNFIMELKKFSYAKIYKHYRLQKFQDYAKLILDTIYEVLMNAEVFVKSTKSPLDTKLSDIVQGASRYELLFKEFENWLSKYSNYKTRFDKDYKKNHHIKTAQVFDVENSESYQKCVIEFISGMTDQFAMESYNEIIQF